MRGDGVWSNVRGLKRGGPSAARAPTSRTTGFAEANAAGRTLRVDLSTRTHLRRGRDLLRPAIEASDQDSVELLSQALRS